VRGVALVLVAGCGFTAKGSSVTSKCALHGGLGSFYCDGFEDGISSNYLLNQGRATLGLDEARAYRGHRSLHFHSDAYDGGDRDYIDAEISVDDSGPVIFAAAAALRVFVYLPAVFDSLIGDVGLLALGDASVLDVDRALSLVTRPGDTLLTTNRWSCLELRNEPADLGATQTLLVDGKVVAQDALPTPPSLHGFALKLTRTSQAAPALDVWFDELIVDSQGIGCDR
jgi:hypothetical protein